MNKDTCHDPVIGGVNEAAVYSGHHPQTLRDAVNMKELACCRRGRFGRMYFRLSHLNRWLSAMEKGARSEPRKRERLAMNPLVSRSDVQLELPSIATFELVIPSWPASNGSEAPRQRTAQPRAAQPTPLGLQVNDANDCGQTTQDGACQ